MPKPNKRMQLEVVGLDQAMQPDQWPESKRKIIGETLARMLQRRKDANEKALQPPLTG